MLFFIFGSLAGILNVVRCASSLILGSVSSGAGHVVNRTVASQGVPTCPGATAPTRAEFFLDSIPETN